MSIVKKLVFLALVACLAAASAAAARQAPKPATNDFILRAPAAEIDAIARRIGLEVVDVVESSPDALGRSVYLMRAPAGASAAEILHDVEALAPEALNIEEVFLASLPETYEGLELDQSTMAILGTLRSSRPLVPPATLDEGWRGAVTDRQLDVEQTSSLTLRRREPSSGFSGDYSIRVDTAEGCGAVATPASWGVTEGPYIERRKVTWRITNHGESPIRLERLTVGWPLANDKLERIRLAGSEVARPDDDTGSSVVDSWKGDPERRDILPGHTADLVLEFDKNASGEAGAYSLSPSVSFQTIKSNDTPGWCRIALHDLRLEGEDLVLGVSNLGDRLFTLDGLTIDWSPEEGAVTAILLGNKAIFYTETVFGRDAAGSPRSVWVGYVEQPAAAVLRVDEANRRHPGEGVIVAVIDSGIDPHHPLLAHRLLPGYDFVRDEASASEWKDLLDQSTMAILGQSTMAILGRESVAALNQSTMAILGGDQINALEGVSLPPSFGHGTMVAGIIHRVAPEARILPLKAFGADGRGNLFDLVRAIYYAVDAGARVINMSFSLETFSPELMRAVNYAAKKGVTCVASAGNEGEETIVYPAALGHTLGVASTSLDDMLSRFSNHGGDLVSIAAPGEMVITSFPGGGWAAASGTSFAAPWVSGAVALFADANAKKGLTGRADYYIASEALSHAAPVQAPSGRAGYGRADLATALDNLKSGVVEEEPARGQYSIRLDFAEGCWAEYPPVSGGSGCELSVGQQLLFKSKKLEWAISNRGGSKLTLDTVTITWPDANGELRKIKLASEEIFAGQAAAPAASFGSGDLVHTRYRRIDDGTTVTLSFEFGAPVVTTY